MTLRVSWAQALAWRLERQFIEPVGRPGVEEVVGRLGAVQAQVASSAEVGIRVRQSSSQPGEVAAALAAGEIVKTWAMRGTLHLLTPKGAASVLPLLAAGRSWELPSWIRTFGATPAEMEVLRDVVTETLDGRVLTRDELVAAITARPGLEHLGERLGNGWGTLLKPLAWQGVLCFGPSQGNRVTFTRPEAISPGWAGLLAPDEAAPEAIETYLGAYGPATREGFATWIARGRLPRRQVAGWFAGLGPRVVEVDVEGRPAHVLAEHADALAAAHPSTTIHLLPGFDAWVLGPGTGDPHVVPPARRVAVSRPSGWIAPIVVRGGVVSGTWALHGAILRVTWFPEAGAAPQSALQEAVGRLAAVLGSKPLDLAVDLGGQD